MEGFTTVELSSTVEGSCRMPLAGAHCSHCGQYASSADGTWAEQTREGEELGSVWERKGWKDT